VDDNEQIRGLIRRALSRHGYQVDVAASVSQARLMSPGGYDALLVDARVGTERGADLIEELRAADPAVARRCLMVTGGGPAGLPADVACLVKPFRPADLISAVRTLPGRDAAPRASSPPRRPAPPGPAADPARTGDRAGTDGDVPGTATAAAPGAGELLRLVARLGAAERAAVADVVHDGPLQDLTAALLSLQLAAGDAPAGLAGQLAGVAGQLGEVATVLRGLVDWAGAAPGPDVSLAEAVRRRADWLVSGPVTVDVQPAATAAGGAAAAIPAIVELALFLLAGDGTPTAATVSVRLTGRQAQIQLGLTGSAPGPDGAGAAGPGAAAGSHRELRRLAAALGGTLRTASAPGGQHAWIIVPAR
jgi:CheY-like chemotaxis protein